MIPGDIRVAYPENYWIKPCNYWLDPVQLTGVVAGAAKGNQLSDRRGMHFAHNIGAMFINRFCGAPQVAGDFFGVS